MQNASPRAVTSTRLSLGVLLFSVLVGQACSGDATAPQPRQRPLVSVLMEFPSYYLPIGGTEQLTLKGRDAAGAEITSGTPVWTSSEPERAVVSATGLLEIKGFGEVVITGTLQDKSVDQSFFGLPRLELSDSLRVSGGEDVLFGWVVTVPENTTRLSVTITGGTGDADLYVSRPVLTDEPEFECVPFVQGSEEACEVENPRAGHWLVFLHGFTLYQGVTLRAVLTPQ